MSTTNLNMIKHYLNGCNGTNDYHRNRLSPNCFYTDGFKYYLDQAQAYWLHDIIMTEVYDALRKNNVPDKYYLTFTVKGSTGRIVLTDYRGNELLIKGILLTTAPEGEILFYCGWDGQRLITCVPQED